MPGSTTRVPDAPPAVAIMPSAGGASLCVLRGPLAAGAGAGGAEVTNDRFGYPVGFV